MHRLKNTTFLKFSGYKNPISTTLKKNSTHESKSVEKKTTEIWAIRRNARPCSFDIVCVPSKQLTIDLSKSKGRVFHGPRLLKIYSTYVHTVLQVDEEIIEELSEKNKDAETLQKGLVKLKNELNKFDS